MADSGSAGDDDEEEEVSRWKKHPFASTFDLISAEYGWTDDQILDLTLARMRLIQEMIIDRRKEQYIENARLAEAHAVSIVSALPALAQGEKAAKAVAKYARKIRFYKRPKKLPRTEDVIRMLSGR